MKSLTKKHSLLALGLVLALAACGSSDSTTPPGQLPPSNPGTQPDPQPDPQPNPDPQPDPQPSPNPQPDPSPQPDPQPNPGVPTTDTFVVQPIENFEKGTEEAQGETINGKLYLFGGFDGFKGCCTPSDRAWVFDPAADANGEWKRLKNMPVPQNGSVTSGSANGGVTHSGIATDGTRKIYYAGGYASDAAGKQQTFGTDAVFEYDVITNDYKQLPNLPAARAAGQLEYVNGKLHFFGGQTLGKHTDSGDHFVLDLAKQSQGWVKLNTRLNDPRNHLGAAKLNGKIYAIGGQHGHDESTQVVSTVEMFDTAQPEKGWTRVTSLPYTLGHIEATFALGNRILVAGGAKGRGRDTEVPTILAFDPTKNNGMGAWSQLKTQLPAPRAGGVAGAIHDGFVYTTGSGKADGWIFEPVKE